MNLVKIRTYSSASLVEMTGKHTHLEKVSEHLINFIWEIRLEQEVPWFSDVYHEMFKWWYFTDMFRKKMREQIHESISVIKLEHFIIFHSSFYMQLCHLIIQENPPLHSFVKKSPITKQRRCSKRSKCWRCIGALPIKILSERTETISDFKHVTLWKTQCCLWEIPGALLY